MIRSCLLTSAAILFAAVFLNFVEPQSAFAQGFYGSSSSLNPWLGLTNRPTGSLDAYNQYVRPRLEVQRALDAQQAQIARQGKTQQEMLRRSNPGAAPGTQSGVQTVGRFSQPATFRNYSHYYNFNKR